jgi:predicted MPP superfamily phosphohydrolase
MLKQYQKITFPVLLFLVFSAILYGIFVEPNRVVVKRIIIRDDHLFNAWHGLRIVQVSDLHITKIGIREKLVIRKIAEIEPDIVCVTGDLAQWGS